LSLKIEKISQLILQIGKYIIEFVTRLSKWYVKKIPL